jgi:hypothetical protein
MSIELRTEEQRRVKRILKRWRRHHAIWFFFVCACIGFVWLNLPISKDYKFVAYVFLWLIPFFVVMNFVTRWTARNFVRSLTNEDRELIIRMGSTSELSELFYACKIDAPNELLRPSSPNKDDSTLLRPATNNGEIPREELLRASNSFANEQPHEETITLKAK